jgi:RNA polymerase sigma factor (sigma-70 family)
MTPSQDIQIQEQRVGVIRSGVLLESNPEGVFFYDGYWIAEKRVHGKSRRKHFPVKQYGEASRQMAIDARNQMERKSAQKIKCQHCGAEFVYLNKKGIGRVPKFCAPKCRVANFTKRFREKTHTAYRSKERHINRLGFGLVIKSQNGMKWEEAISAVNSANSSEVVNFQDIEFFWNGISLETPVAGDATLADILPDENGQEYTDEPTDEPTDEKREYVKKLLSTLTENERKIIMLRISGKTGPETGRILGFTKQNVSVSEKNAMEKLGLQKLARFKLFARPSRPHLLSNVSS